MKEKASLSGEEFILTGNDDYASDSDVVQTSRELFEKHVDQYADTDIHNYDPYNEKGRRMTKAFFYEEENAHLVYATPEFICRRFCYYGGVIKDCVVGERLNDSPCTDHSLGPGGYSAPFFGLAQEGEDSEEECEGDEEGTGAHGEEEVEDDGESVHSGQSV